MATRIALYEAGADARFIQVDGRPSARARFGLSRDQPARPGACAPHDEGEVLTENAAILQHVAGRFPDAGLAPPAGMERARLQQWLSFVGTELHKAFFVPQLDRKAPDAVKTYALEKGESRVAYLDKYLAGRDYLLGRQHRRRLSLHRAQLEHRDTGRSPRWPAVKATTQMRERPSIAKALAETRARRGAGPPEGRIDGRGPARRWCQGRLASLVLLRLHRGAQRLGDRPRTASQTKATRTCASTSSSSPATRWWSVIGARGLFVGGGDLEHVIHRAGELDLHRSHHNAKPGASAQPPRTGCADRRRAGADSCCGHAP
jgi:glutathione S-transferase